MWQDTFLFLSSWSRMPSLSVWPSRSRNDQTLDHSCGWIVWLLHPVVFFPQGGSSSFLSHTVYILLLPTMSSRNQGACLTRPVPDRSTRGHAEFLVRLFLDMAFRVGSASSPSYVGQGVQVFMALQGYPRNGQSWSSCLVLLQFPIENGLGLRLVIDLLTPPVNTCHYFHMLASLKQGAWFTSLVLSYAIQ